MKHLALPLAFILLVGCSPVETKEYSCAPQNMRYDEALKRLICVRAGAVSESTEPISIYCKEGTYKEKNGALSCVDSNSILHTIEPITFSDEESFAHKQECQKLLPQVEKRLKDADKELSFNESSQISSVDKIFYSVSMNSCLYTWKESTYYKNSNESFDLFAIGDALTGQKLLNVLAIFPSDSYEKDRERFEQEIKVYE